MDISNSSHRLGFSLAIIIIVGVGAWYFLGTGSGELNEQAEVESALLNPSDVLLPGDTDSSVQTGVGNDLQERLSESSSMTETQVTKATSVILRTSSGDIEIELFPDKAPKTVANFAKLAQDGYYDETKFHRVIKGFMIQGGDPFTKDDTMMDRWGTGGPGYQFEDEINDQKIVRGVLAMANAGPGTNGSQFFIVTAESAPWLDGKHTVFGKVVKGMDIVDRIENVRTGERDIPATPIVIKSIMVK